MELLETLFQPITWKMSPGQKFLVLKLGEKNIIFAAHII